MRTTIDNLTPDELNAAAEELYGTSGNMDVAVAEGLNIDVADLPEAMQEHVFTCETCGWWAPIDERSDNGECEQCDSAGDHQEDES
jgi:hypothetical protein